MSIHTEMQHLLVDIIFHYDKFPEQFFVVDEQILERMDEMKIKLKNEVKKYADNKRVKK